MFKANRGLISLTIVFLLAVCSAVISLSVTSKTSAVSVKDTGFSIMQISDTQYLSWQSPNLYFDLTRWIVNNSAYYNLKMVIHTGDLVDTPNHTSEWEVANSAIMTLYDNGVPYCWNAGNHDQLPPNETANLWLGDSNTDWLGSQYPAFNQTIMRQQPYWVSDIYDGKNTAVAFNCLNCHFLIINMEFLANSSTINWMQTLIRNNPNTNVIVATHDYLNQQGTYGTHSVSNEGVLDIDWGNSLKATLDQYPNVFMTTSGHILSTTAGAYNKQSGNREEIFFNRQELDNKTGAASVRIYNFDLSKMQVNVSTYALDIHTWLADSQNQFSFSINLQPFAIAEFPSSSVLTVFIMLISILSLAIRRKHNLSI